MKSYKVTGLEAITEPRGLAVDSLRKILYCINGPGNLYASRLYINNNGQVASEAPKKIVENLTSRFVAVDFRGKVFAVVDNQIVSIKAEKIVAKLDDSSLLPEQVVSDAPAGQDAPATSTTTTTAAPAPADDAAADDAGVDGAG